MSKYHSQTQDKFTVRFPDGMRDAIAKRAEENGRSMNSEILQILQDALDGSTSNASNIISLDECHQGNSIYSINPSELTNLLSALAAAEPALKIISAGLTATPLKNKKTKK